MIFVGDIALPYKNAIRCSNFPTHFYSRNWFGNLEGPIVNYDNNKLNAVYNHRDAIRELTLKFNFKGFALANNHIFDTGNFEDTISFLNNKNILHCGIGTDINKANKEIFFEDKGVQLVIVNFGWEVIQCEITTGNYKGINPLRKEHVLHTISSLVEKYPDAKIIAFMHWSYELEGEPQPYERELAKKIIEIGASGVIGCHPHRIGGFEMYKGKPIVYSLGNWMFKQNHYFNGNLKFPNFCNLQLAFEWNMKTDDFKFHFFEYFPYSSEIKFISTESRESEKIKELTPFQNFSTKEYEKWYRNNHYHKNKGLPVYYWSDTHLSIAFKNKWVKFRDRLLKIIFNKGK